MLAGNKYDSIKKVVTWAAVADFLERLPNEEELNAWKNTGVHFIENGRTKQSMPMKYAFVDNLLSFPAELNIQTSVINLQKPLLLVHGVNDETVALENAQRIKSWKKEAKLVVIERCNHTFNGKHPWVEAALPKATLDALVHTTLFLKL